MDSDPDPSVATHLCDLQIEKFETPPYSNLAQLLFGMISQSDGL